MIAAPKNSRLCCAIDRLPSFALALLVSLALSSLASAQTDYFFQPAPTDPEGSRLWQSPGNWLNPNTNDMFVPNSEFNETANINNGATAVLTVDMPNTGEDSVVTPGALVISNGGLAVRSTGALEAKIFDTGGNGISTGEVFVGGAGSLAIDAGGSVTAQGNVTFEPGSSFQVGITSSDNGLLSTAGSAQLGGTLSLDFAGFTPTGGQSWTIMEATAFNGGFEGISSNGAFAFNQAITVNQVNLPGGNVGINALVEEVLVLNVNRNTGAVSITHPGSSTITLDGYFVGSQGGLLSDNAADWTSLTESGQLGSDWLETAQATNNVAELKIGGDATFGSQINLGNIYNPLAGAFGQAVEDLTFGFRRSSDGAEFPGVVQYTGDRVNSLLLQVDPTGSGDAYLRNTSDTTVQIDAYEILSANGELSTAGWNSLDEQNGAGNTWLEAIDVDSTLLAEFDSEGFTTIAPGASLNLGPLFAGGTQDLEFNFLMMGEEEASEGVVLYQEFVIGDADFDGSGSVNGLDFLAWQRGESPNPLSPGDLQLWETSYGSPLSAIASVPEPSCALLLMTIVPALARLRQRA